MKYQNVFERYEIKYLITTKQKSKILKILQLYMQLDKYGKTIIRNIYFDTDNYYLIRKSLEKPIYKEKLRLRSYQKADEDTKVFFEIKKKYQAIVYKRRIAITLSKYKKLEQEGFNDNSNQILKEINYFFKLYPNLKPKVFLSYERESYFMENSDLRITFDENIIARNYDLDLKKDIYGTKILEDGYLIMEIKCFKAMPLWLVSILSKEKIYKTPFSKYGTYYVNNICNNKGENKNGTNI